MDIHRAFANNSIISPDLIHNLISIDTIPGFFIKKANNSNSFLGKYNSSPLNKRRKRSVSNFNSELDFSTFDIGALLNKASILRSEEHTSELQSRPHLVCRLLLEKKNETNWNEHQN